MPNTETVRELVSAFNLYSYGRNTVKANFKLRSGGKTDYIVLSFEKSMDMYQCGRYLDSIKRKIIGEFYDIEGSNDAEILDTAKPIFDVDSFPFDISDRGWFRDEQDGYKFVTPVDKGVILNLKSHLAASLAKDVLEGMPTCDFFIKAPGKKDYLWHGKFPNKDLREEFGREFLSRMKERYENVPKNLLKAKGSSVYIRDAFDDARFIDNVTQRVAWLVGMYLGVDSSANHKVKLFKDMIVEYIGKSTGVTICGFVCASPLNREEASILIPLVLDSGGRRMLTNEEALELNYAFNYAVFNDLYGGTRGELSVNGSNVVYGIDFSNKEISHCVITKIIESSVIDKDHELSIGPELRFRALSPVRSPFNSPTHAGPSGLRTPLNRRKTDTDSGYDSNSPPKLKDSGARSSSGGPGPSAQPSGMEWESSTRSQDGVSKESPRQGLVSVPQLDPLDVPGTSGGPLTRLSSTAVGGGVRETSSSVQSVGTVQNVQAGTSAWSQPINPWSSSASSAGLWSLPQIRPSSSKGANEGVQTGKSIWYASSSHSPDVEDVKSIFSVEPEKQQVSGECSEAKSKESGSLKKRKGDFLCRERWLPLTNFSSFKRHDAGRDTMRSTPETPVTEKPPVPKAFFSFPGRRKAKSNPPSEVTSPTHEGGPEWQQRLNPDQREELRPLLSPELQKKLGSNSLSPEDEQPKHLLYTPSGQEKMKKNFESQEENLRRSVSAQLPANPSSKKVDRDGGFCSMGSPAVPHKGSVSSKVKECDLQQAKYMSKALGKN